MFGTVNANQRLPIRLLTACGVLAATLGAAGAIAPSPHAGKLANNSQALGYDSRLWQSVYHPDNPRDAPDRPAAADAFHSGPTGVPMQNAVPMQNTLRVAGGEPIGFEPLGQLIVDEDPGGDPVEGRDTPLSGWERIRVASTGEGSSGPANGGGPTPIIVGFATAIVVCGAMFSGTG